MASSCRALSSLLLRRAPSIEAVCRLSPGARSLETVCKIAPVASVVSIYKVASLKVPYVVGDLHSPTTTVKATVQESDDIFDPEAQYPAPAESLNMLAPLKISGFASDLGSPKLSAFARCFASIGSHMADEDAEAVLTLEYKPSHSETAMDTTNQTASEIFESLPPCPAESLCKLAPLRIVSFAGDHERSVMLGTVSVLPSQSYGTRAAIKFQSRGSIRMVSRLACTHGFKSFPIFVGRRMLCAGQAKGDLNKFEDFEKLYQKDRIHVCAGLDHIVTQLCAIKEEVDQSDFVQKWMSETAKETLQLSEVQIDGIQRAYTGATYVFGFMAWGSLVFFGLKTVKENDIPFRDYSLLLNSVRVQALQRGIDHYRSEKKIRDEAEMAKAAKAAAVKKNADEAAVEKKAKEAEAAALRKAKVQQAGAERKAKSDQAAAVRKAKVKEVHAARLAEWKQANAARKEAAEARKAKADQAAVERKFKASQAAAKRKAKADQLAAAATAERKAKAVKSDSKK